MSRTLLMVAFHYPPLRGSSGIQRTVQFCRYLPQNGWNPVVLTAGVRAYPDRDEMAAADAPNFPITRAFALDAARNLSFRGRYFKSLALPDRWSTWILGALPAGLRLIQKHRPSLIWSTYPIATAHLIGLVLHRLTGVPWIADFRDSMTEDGYPRDPTTWRVFRWIEAAALCHASLVVFTAPGTLAMYARRYPSVSPTRLRLVANGYDEGEFKAAESSCGRRCPSTEPVVLVHSGILYPSERDPRAFFDALQSLRKAGRISRSNLRVVLRASGNEETYRRELKERDIEDVVFLAPAVSYQEALREMLEAHGLLLFQASNCNHQVPAKLYEYLRARRPVLALTDERGDTADALRSAGVGTIVSLDSGDAIASGLIRLIEEIRTGRGAVASDVEIQRHSREARARELAALLDGVVSDSKR